MYHNEFTLLKLKKVLFHMSSSVNEGDIIQKIPSLNVLIANFESGGNMGMEPPHGVSICVFTVGTTVKRVAIKHDDGICN